ncbi:heme-binding protein [Streptomyces sp. NPDC001135]
MNWLAPGGKLAEADRIVEAALAVGAERGFPPLAVAVVDVAAEVIVLRRADGGMPMTSRIAVAKARTALRALQPSGLINLPGGIVDTIQHLYDGDSVPWAGGVLVTDGEVILGAAGASGAHAVEDEEAVRTAVRRWRENRCAGRPEVVPGAVTQEPVRRESS